MQARNAGALIDAVVRNGRLRIRRQVTTDAGELNWDDDGSLGVAGRQKHGQLRTGEPGN